jgi:hypothetical protein
MNRREALAILMALPAVKEGVNNLLQPDGETVCCTWDWTSHGDLAGAVMVIDGLDRGA